MKKYLLWLPFILLICSSAISNIQNNKQQQTVNKSISFVIHKSINYSSGIYKNTSAQLQITIARVSGASHQVVWNKTFGAKLLRDYPAPESAIMQTITVPGVNNTKEHFEVVYTRIYNSNGYTLQIQNAAVINKDSDKIINIGI